MNAWNPLVSVVIPALDEEKYIGRVIKCLKDQDYPQDKIEIIVVDNGSVDKTAEVSEKLGAKVLKLKQRGVSLARQKGSEIAKGDIISGVDADVVLPKNWITEMVSVLSDNEVVGVTGIIRAHSKSLWIQFLYIISFEFYFLVSFVTRHVYFSGMNFGVKRDAFFKSGGFNIDLKAGEDLDLSLKVAKFGKLLFSRKVVVYSSTRRMKEGAFTSFWRYIVTFFAIRWGIGKAPGFHNYR